MTMSCNRDQLCFGSLNRELDICNQGGRSPACGTNVISAAVQHIERRSLRLHRSILELIRIIPQHDRGIPKGLMLPTNSGHPCRKMSPIARKAATNIGMILKRVQQRTGTHNASHPADAAPFSFRGLLLRC